jgi:hypothetical protein
VTGVRSAIAIIMAVLGTVLVLSGASALWAAALVRPRSATGTPEANPETRAGRAVDAVSRMPSPDRLIMWGVVLLALSAVAAGAVTVSASATAGNQ